MSEFVGEKNYEHGSPHKTGILLTNLGTPDAPTAKAVKPYLHQFLSDPRVIELPRFFWQIILRGIILQIRPKRSAKNYSKIWTKEGSPLLQIAKKQLDLVKIELQSNYSNTVVELAMRYGNPSIESALKKLQQKQIRRLLVFPLYPQYCAATTASTFDAVTNVLRKWRWIPELRFINSYFESYWIGYVFWKQHNIASSQNNIRFKLRNIINISRVTCCFNFKCISSCTTS